MTRKKELSSLPLSDELLQYYKQRVGTWEGHSSIIGFFYESSILKAINPRRKNRKVRE
jgi:hypothetical protein